MNNQFELDEKNIEYFMKTIIDVFQNNRIRLENADAIFCYGFSPTQVSDAEKSVLTVLERLKRNHVHVDCHGKSYREILFCALKQEKDKRSSQVLHSQFVNSFTKESYTLVLSNISTMKEKQKQKPLVARELIKTLDDAHFDGTNTMSDVIIIDFASFLETAWNEISCYSKTIAPFKYDPFGNISQPAPV